MINEELTMRAILGMPPDEPVEDVIVPAAEIEVIGFIPEVEEITEQTEDKIHSAPILEDAEIISTLPDTEPTGCEAVDHPSAESPLLTEKQYYFILGMRKVIKFLNDRKVNLERQVNIPGKTIVEKLEAEIAERTIAECIAETEKYMRKCIQSTENRQTIHQ